MADNAQTKWPTYITGLYPELSEATERACLPRDVEVEAPANTVAPSYARFSGLWAGWAGAGRIVDLKLAVESVTDAGARIVCARAVAGHDLLVERQSGVFVENELRITMDSGTVAAYRIRNADAMETFWSSNNGTMGGVLTRVDPNSHTSFVRIPSAGDDGNDSTLEVVVFEPAHASPSPVLVFNHGSTGMGDDPSIFGLTWTCPPLARYFTERGFSVIFPQRRGRGKSDGDYGEGLAEDGSGYSLDVAVTLAGAERALEDVAAVLAWINRQPQFDSTRILIGGQSRGGMLSLAAAGGAPDSVCGVLNFVGGWLSESCATATTVNQELCNRGASFDGDTIWLYADQDPFYSLDHSRANFDAFKKAGGLGNFYEMPLNGSDNGHMVVFDTASWCDPVAAYLDRLPALGNGGKTT